jgi:DNA-binding transcriptional MerR regulator
MQKSRTQWHGRRRFSQPAGWIYAASLTCFIAAGFVGLMNGGAHVASADELQLAQSPNPNAALTVTEIRDCLCMEQQMGSYREDLELRQDLLNERQQELANISQQVQEQRAALSPDDTVGQQVLKDLMVQQQSLRDLLQNDLRPAYNTEVNKLNALVSGYNGQCVNRQRYTIDIKTAQQDLQCPKP